MKLLILMIIFMFMWILGIVAALLLVSVFVSLFWRNKEQAKVPCVVILMIATILAGIVFFKNYDWLNELITIILIELKEAK